MEPQHPTRLSPAPRRTPRTQDQGVNLHVAPQTASAVSRLSARLENRSARIGVIGLGYVGLPLAVEFAKAGFRVTGFEIDAKRAASLNRGISYIQDVPTGDVRGLVREDARATLEFDELAKMDVVDICVPTPLRKTKDPDVSYIVAAVAETAPRLKRGQLVVLESTTYPGTTDELVLPMLAEGGLQVGKDFFSPSRPSGSTRGTRRTRPRTFPRSWAASRRTAPGSCRSSTARSWTRSCPSAPRAWPRW